MMGRRLFLALAILVIALLADGVLVGSAFAQDAAPAEGAHNFVFRFSIFVLAIFVGYYVVWSVTPALHTPLMSVTNAISGIILVGALLQVGHEDRLWVSILAFIGILVASINVFGGFTVTGRMLQMFKREDSVR
jgi:NAD(P) transhydrogenase subunit alpha